MPVTDFPDYQEPAATAAAIGNTNLTGTGLAKESGGNLDKHTTLLNGTAAGALIANIGATIGQEVAAQIATGSAAGTPGGTPLLHGAKQVFNVTAQVVGPSASFNTGFFTVAKPGYLINIRANHGVGPAAVPFVLADVEWRVAASGALDTAEELWYISGGNNTNRRTTGKGPTKGDQMRVTFTNGDAVNSVTLSVTIWETTQHIPRDDWRGDSATASATAPAIKNDALANVLASDSFNVAAASQVTRLLPLYAGPVNMWINQNTAAGSTVTVNPQGDFSLTSLNPVVQLDWTQAPFGLKNLYLPRCPCSLVVLNQGGVAATFNVGITALEQVS